MTATASIAPVEAEDLLEIIKQDAFRLRYTWMNYRFLFAGEKKNVDVLNAAGPGFFGMTQRVIADDVILGIFRLTDPAANGNQENTTLKRLLRATEVFWRSSLVQAESYHSEDHFEPKPEHRSSVPNDHACPLFSFRSLFGLDLLPQRFVARADGTRGSCASEEPAIFPQARLAAKVTFLASFAALQFGILSARITYPLCHTVSLWLTPLLHSSGRSPRLFGCSVHG